MPPSGSRDGGRRGRRRDDRARRLWRSRRRLPVVEGLMRARLVVEADVSSVGWSVTAAGTTRRLSTSKKRMRIGRNTASNICTKSHAHLAWFLMNVRQRCPKNRATDRTAAPIIESSHFRLRRLRVGLPSGRGSRRCGARAREHPRIHLIAEHILDQLELDLRAVRQVGRLVEHSRPFRTCARTIMHALEQVAFPNGGLRTPWRSSASTTRISVP